MLTSADRSLDVQAHWFRALTLQERAELPGAGGSPLPPGRDAAARSRLDRWRLHAPFDDGAWLDRRFACAGLDSSAALYVLGEEEQALRRRCRTPPPWVQALSEAVASNGGPQAPLEPAAFTDIVQPFMDRAYGRLCRELVDLKRRHPGVPFHPERTASLLFEGVPRRLDWMLSRAVVLEMHVARLEGKLPGDTPRERFRRFVDRLSEPVHSLELLGEYPVLARLVVQSLELWRTANLELVTHLCEDWEALRSNLLSEVGLLGELIEVGSGLGDLHRGGRSVRTLLFSSGARVVYKPRSLGVDRLFRGLLARLNERGAPDLWYPRVLDRGSRGWVEFVAPAPCASQRELDLFYRRQGAYLALFYALQAHDFHRENLIASGSHPVPIDLETLFGPDFGRGSRSGYDSLAAYELANSVRRVMLLPYLQDDSLGRGLEPSGLGGAEGQHSLFKISVWENHETDAMRLRRGRAPLPPADNRPTLETGTVDVTAHVEPLVEGFTEMYRLLVRHRGELLEALDRFADAEVRVIFKDTDVYSLILRESYHPDHLRDALERDRFFDRIWFDMIENRLAGVHVRLHRYELEDLWRGDVPYFSTRVASRDVWTSRGERLEGLLSRTGLETVKARFEGLDEKDLAHQVGLVRQSFAAMLMVSEPAVPRYAVTEPVPPAAKEDLIEGAAEVIERLKELARVDSDGASWTGLTPLRRGWQLRALFLDFYAGLPGVVFALAHLADVLQRDDVRVLAEEGFRTLRRLVDRYRHRVRNLGAYMGWGGLLHTWVHLGTLWRDDAILEQACAMVPSIRSLVAADRTRDLVFGAAGAVPPLLGLYRVTGTEQALEVARELGDHLIAQAVERAGGVGWITIEPDQPLTGFSHGAAGIAWVLMELHDVTGEDRYRTLALKALGFENALFDPEVGNWPDLRESSNGSERRFAAAWCNGAGGIGLSRLTLLDRVHEMPIGADVEVAVESTLRQGFGLTHCLCHGDLGNLELVAEAARRLGHARWEQEAERIRCRVVASIRQNGWRCGVPLTQETPGLMEGLAGIGYGLVKAAYPERLPSVLLLEPPLKS